MDPTPTPRPFEIEQTVLGFDQVHVDMGLDNTWHVTAVRYDPLINNKVGRRVTVPRGTSPEDIRQKLELAFAGHTPDPPPRTRKYTRRA